MSLTCDPQGRYCPSLSASTLYRVDAGKMGEVRHRPSPSLPPGTLFELRIRVSPHEAGPMYPRQTSSQHAGVTGRCGDYCGLCCCLGRVGGHHNHRRHSEPVRNCIRFGAIRVALPPPPLTPNSREAAKDDE